MDHRWRAIVDASPSKVVVVDRDGVIIDVNRSCEPFARASMIGTSARELVDSSEREPFRATLERVLHTGVVEHAEVRAADGRVYAVQLVPVLAEDAVQEIILRCDDVTERNRDRFFELSADLLCVVGPDGFFRRLNPFAWEDLLGWTNEELLAKPYLELVHPDDQAATLAMQDRAVHGPIASFENRYLCRDGSYRWIQWKSAYDASSGLIYAIARDITDKRRIDERLLHAQKMEAIGRLAGGVAHDINNMLAVIYSSTELLLGGTPDAETSRSEILDIQHVAQRSAALVRQLLAFGRKRPRAVREVDVDDAVGPLAKMIARCAGSSIHVIARAKAAINVRIDPSELESILMNLALNARDAMPDGGTIEIETEARHVGTVRANELGVDPGRFVAIRVRDTGCGIPAELRHKVFEPFFTTKELGKGTGLGLATVFGIVQECGGTVDIESTVGQGTTITVLLPCATRRSTRSRPKMPAAYSSVTAR